MYNRGKKNDTINLKNKDQKMRRLFLILLAASLSLGTTAQLYVLSINGQVQIRRGNVWKDVFVSDILYETDILKTEPYGSVVIQDKKEHKNYPIQSATPQSVKQLISKDRKKTPSLTLEFCRGVDKLVRGLGSLRALFPETGGGVYKGENTNLLIAKALLSSGNSSSYPISMTLLDGGTLQPLEKVCVDQSFLIEITNDSDTPLFVNIIDRDETGKQEALIHVNDSCCLPGYYVPASSTIRVTSGTTFYPANTTDQLTLVAYPIPFYLPDVIELMNKPEIINDSAFINEPIGIYHMSVPIISAGSY